MTIKTLDIIINVGCALGVFAVAAYAIVVFATADFLF